MLFIIVYYVCDPKNTVSSGELSQLAARVLYMHEVAGFRHSLEAEFLSRTISQSFEDYITCIHVSI